MDLRPKKLLYYSVQRIFRVRTAHDVRRVLRALQLVLTFGLLIVLPVLLLAYFALASTQGASLSLEATLSPRTDPIMRQVMQQERSIFVDFERQITRRDERNQSAVHSIRQLSPYLLAAYQVDQRGLLQEPFGQPLGLQESIEPNVIYAAQWRRGLQAEGKHQHVLAAAYYKSASENIRSRRLQGQARLAYARALSHAGQGAGVYSDVIGEYGDVRDPNGFLIGDLARLAQAELGAQRNPDSGALALRELAKLLLDDGRWTLGEGGRPNIVRRVITSLEGYKDDETINPDWLASAWTRLNTRDEQLYESTVLFGEMNYIRSNPQNQAGDGFTYVHGPGALWAVRSTSAGRILFAFDVDLILSDLRQTAQRLAQVDPDLIATVSESEPNTRGEGVFRQSLDYIAGHDVQVSAADPDALTAQRRSRLNTQIAIILLAMGTSVVGVVVTVRFVGRELQSARMKTDFAANVSHELRSPITQIRLKGESLLLDLVFDDDDRQQHYEAIVRESERLSRLVDNVLDFASIESGTKRYTFRPEDVTRVIYNTVDTARASLDQAGFSVEVDVPEDLPVVWIDREAISQVLTNLVSNAIKYGSDGRWLGVSANVIGQQVEIRVSDRGMGIKREDQKQVFENFFRSADPEVRKRKGTGIGLTIVRYIVEAHGGTISVESVPNAGATFVIQLPLQPPQGAGA